MVNWNNLDTVASYAELEKVDRVKLVDVLAGEAGADRVRKYSASMVDGMTFNYASRPVDDKVLEVLAKLAKEKSAPGLRIRTGTPFVRPTFASPE